MPNRIARPPARYALYAHLKPNSQQFARLGNSGNTSAPHLLEIPQPREDELPLSQSVETFPAPEED